MLQLTIILFDLCGMVGTTAAPVAAHRWGAMGNTTTCEIQGFLIQFCFCTFVPLDMFLSICHVLIVRYNWSEAQLRAVEKPLHVIVWPLGLGLAIFPLFTNSYNSSWENCWLNKYPSGCGDDDIPCERGGNWLSDILVSTILVGMSTITAIVSMTSIYCFVRGRENGMRRFDFEAHHTVSASDLHTAQTSSRRMSLSSSRASIGRQRSRATGIQGILYCCVTLISCVPAILFMVVDQMYGWNLLLATFGGSMLPLLGLFNMMVYFRTRTTMQTPYGRFIKGLLRRCRKVCCCCCCQNKAENRALSRPSMSPTRKRFAEGGLSDTSRCSFAARPDQDAVKIVEGISEPIEDEKDLPA